jgi:hypothetical protein
MPQPNWVVAVGMAKETVWGTPISPPTMMFSTDKPMFDEKQTPVYDRGLRGIRSALQGMVFAEGHTEVDMPNMPWYGDDSGNLLMAMMGADAITGAAKNGTIGAVAAGATSVTYTVGSGGASVTGDIFKIDAGLPTQEIVIPTSIAANVWTVPATGPNSFKFAHTASAPAIALFTHTMTVLNTGQPPSYTLAKFDNLVATARQIAGVYFEDVTLKFVNPGALTVDAKGRGKMGINITKPVFPAYSGENFNVPWQSTFTIAAVANARVVDFSLSIKAANDQIFGMANTQSPTAAVSDQLTVTGSGTVVPDDYTEFNYYINNTQPSVALTVDNGSTRTLFQMSKVAILGPTHLDHSANYSKLPFTFEAIANSTDAGTGNAPIKAVLMSSKAVAY